MLTVLIVILVIGACCAIFEAIVTPTEKGVSNTSAYLIECNRKVEEAKKRNLEVKPPMSEEEFISKKAKLMVLLDNWNINNG